MRSCVICLQCNDTEDNPLMSVREENRGRFGCSCDAPVHLLCIERWRDSEARPQCILCNSPGDVLPPRRSFAPLFCCAVFIGTTTAAAIVSFENLIGIRAVHADPYITLLPV